MPPPAPRTAVPTRLTPRARRGQARGASNPTARPRLRWRARASLADEGGCPRTASGTRRALGGGVFPPATSSPFHLEVFPSAHPAPPNEPHPRMSTHAEPRTHANTYTQQLPGSVPDASATPNGAQTEVGRPTSDATEYRAQRKKVAPSAACRLCAQLPGARSSAHMPWLWSVCRHPVKPRREAIRPSVGQVTSRPTPAWALIPQAARVSGTSKRGRGGWRTRRRRTQARPTRGKDGKEHRVTEERCRRRHRARGRLPSRRVDRGRPPHRPWPRGREGQAGWRRRGRGGRWRAGRGIGR